MGMLTLACLCQPTLCPQEEAELGLPSNFSWQNLLCITGTLILPLRSGRSSAGDTL